MVAGGLWEGVAGMRVVGRWLGDLGTQQGLVACGWPHRSVLAGTSVPLATHRRTQPSSVTHVSGRAGLAKVRGVSS